jgi:hypothetical protein
MIVEALLGLLLAATPEPGAAPQKTRIAVLDLQYAGAGDRRAVEGLSALLASEVARRPGLAVVSGADLRTLVGFERQKAMVGCSGGGCAGELAGALGVAYLVSSEVSAVGSSWLLSLGLLDATRSSSVARLTRKGATIDALLEEAPRAVDELLAALGPVGTPPPVTRFDGSWDVSIACPASSQAGAKGYAFHFPATVKEGQLRGNHLADGTPGALKVEGSIQADGRAFLKGSGLTGSAAYNVKQAASGTPYEYSISARFEQASGSGSRIEGRECSFGFTRR